MAQIAAGASAGDDFIIPFCIREIATVLVLLRTFDLHPGNIDDNLHPRNVSNVAQEAARSGTLYVAIEEPGHPTQAYIVTQFEQLVRALVGFARIHGAIVLRDGVYSWDATLPMWTHRQAAVEQWLRSKGCPIGAYHQIGPCQWLMAYMKPNPDGSGRCPEGGTGKRPLRHDPPGGGGGGARADTSAQGSPTAISAASSSTSSTTLTRSTTRATGMLSRRRSAPSAASSWVRGRPGSDRESPMLGRVVAGLPAGVHFPFAVFFFPPGEALGWLAGWFWSFVLGGGGERAVGVGGRAVG